LERYLDVYLKSSGVNNLFQPKLLSENDLTRSNNINSAPLLRYPDIFDPIISGPETGLPPESAPSFAHLNLKVKASVSSD
jgi:hypothetical protein